MEDVNLVKGIQYNFTNCFSTDFNGAMTLGITALGIKLQKELSVTL
jgi:hypothetical protein